VFTGVEFAIPLVVRAAVDMFESGSFSRGYLLVLFLVLVGAGGAKAVARFAQRLLMINASRRFEYDLRNDYFSHVQRLGQDFFHRVKTGDIMARATNDLTYARMFAGPGVMGTVDLVRLPIAILVLSYLSVELTLVALIPVPIVLLLVYKLLMALHRQSREVQDQFGDVSSLAQENLAGARVVKAYGAEERELRTFRAESMVYKDKSMRLAMISAGMWPLIGLLMATMTAIVLWHGGNMVILGEQVTRPAWDGGLTWVTARFTVGDFSGFLVAVFMLMFPLVEFGWVLTVYQRGSAAMKRILDVMTEKPSIADAGDAEGESGDIRGALRFEDVSFSYAGEPVLRGVSFEVPAGKTVAVVGPTGSGKSSVVSLLVREYDPSDGCVLLDGQDIRRVPLTALRGAIGYVPQDGFLFSDTVRANIAFGRADATDEEILHACELAQFREALDEMPAGLDTLLGERGVNLSGGQKQRLTIARALVCDPRILILDDALSSVDTHTEERILRGLRSFMRERTSVLISHRVSTVSHADQILVLNNGRIVERGTHAELVDAGGLYAEMHLRQQLEEKLEDE
jgi:ATP-binding cassette subfamily B protein